MLFDVVYVSLIYLKVRRGENRKNPYEQCLVLFCFCFQHVLYGDFPLTFSCNKVVCDLFSLPIPSST